MQESCALGVKHREARCKISDQETRDQWWEELRAEVKSHARALNCACVLGYREYCAIYNDVCILSAVGTAAVVRKPRLMWKLKSEMLAVARAIATESAGDRADEGAKADAGGGDGATSRDNGRENEDARGDEGEGGGELRQRRLSKGSFASFSSGEYAAAIAAVAGPDERPHDRSRSGKKFKKHLSPLAGSVVDAMRRRVGTGGLGTVSAVLEKSSYYGKRRRKKRDKEILAKRYKAKVKALERPLIPCSVCHVPYNSSRKAPFANMKLVPCGLCRGKWVPEVLIATVEPPPLLPITGKGILIESRVCRARHGGRGKNVSAEDASNVSDDPYFLRSICIVSHAQAKNKRHERCV